MPETVFQLMPITNSRVKQKLNLPWMIPATHKLRGKYLYVSAFVASFSDAIRRISAGDRL